jgi:hypothetical protein
MVMIARKDKYIAAFFVTTVVFLLGIFIGSEITGSRLESLQRQLTLDIMEAQSLEIELSILQLFGGIEDKCNYIESRIPEIVKKKVEVGRKFDIEDIPEEEADVLASQFIISLGRYVIFNEVQERECGVQKPKILFFKDESEASRQQARVLDNIVFGVSDLNITVLTFTTTFSDHGIIKLLYRVNNITVTPSLLIKGAKYEGFQPLEKVTGILCQNYANSYTRSICP